jgi:phospholipid transport system substrate-binding protein
MGSVFSSVLLLPSFVLASKDAVALESGAKDFIEKLAEEALISLTKSELTGVERRELFRDIMRRYFAFKVIAKWVLGRFWKYATDIEKTEYLDLFEQLMVITYADRFQTYSGEKLVVVKSETRGKNILVHTRLERPNDQEPIAVIWRLQAVTNSYGIVDVMVEGFSMGLTQKKEFKSVIRKNNNKVEALLSELRKRINAGT